MNITAIRNGLETNIETIAGFRAYSEIPENPVTPCAVITLSNINYDQAYQKGLTEFAFTVTVIVGRFSVVQAQQNLNDYANNDGDKSVKTAIESDPTLSGSAVDVRVVSMDSISALDLNDGNNYLGMDFSVTVYAE